jgi:hypothetical protein
MRMRKAKSLKRWQIVVLLLLIFVFSCAPVQFLPVNKHIADLQYYDEFQGLKIGASAYIDPIQSRETFGTDLFSKGIIPILVIIENETNLTFLLEQKYFTLYPDFQRETAESDETIHLPTTDTADIKTHSTSDTVIAASTTAIGAAGVASFSVTVLEAGGATETVASIASLNIPVNVIYIAAIIPLSIASEFSSRNIQITHHMTAEALEDRTLHQGQSMHGFLYFLCDSFNEKIRSQEFRLHITFRSISDETLWNVDLPLGRLFPKEVR